MSSWIARFFWIAVFVLAMASTAPVAATSDTPLKAQVEPRAKNVDIARHRQEPGNGSAMVNSVADLQGLLHDLQSATSPDARLLAAEIVVGAADALMAELELEILANDERYSMLWRKLHAIGPTLPSDHRSTAIANHDAFAFADSLWEDHGRDVFDERVERAFKLRSRLDGLTGGLRLRGHIVGPYRNQAQIHDALAHATLVDRVLQDKRELALLVTLQLERLARRQTAFGGGASGSDLVELNRSFDSVLVSSAADRRRLGFAQASALR